jgi:CBS domain-containing protein
MSPTGSASDPLRHSFTVPPFERATVLDAMRLGVISCPQEAGLQEIARILATYRIHCVVVDQEGAGGKRPWGVITDLDVALAAGPGSERRTAGEVARTEMVTVTPEEPLAHAVRLMAEHDVSHLVVVHVHSGQPVGVLSALDLAGVIAWGCS